MNLTLVLGNLALWFSVEQAFVPNLEVDLDGLEARLVQIEEFKGNKGEQTANLKFIAGFGRVKQWGKREARQYQLQKEKDQLLGVELSSPGDGARGYLQCAQYGAVTFFMSIAEQSFCRRTRLCLPQRLIIFPGVPYALQGAYLAAWLASASSTIVGSLSGSLSCLRYTHKQASQS